MKYIVKLPKPINYWIWILVYRQKRFWKLNSSSWDHFLQSWHFSHVMDQLNKILQMKNVLDQIISKEWYNTELTEYKCICIFLMIHIICNIYNITFTPAWSDSKRFPGTSIWQKFSQMIDWPLELLTWKAVKRSWNEDLPWMMGFWIFFGWNLPIAGLIDSFAWGSKKTTTVWKTKYRLKSDVLPMSIRNLTRIG